MSSAPAWGTLRGWRSRMAGAESVRAVPERVHRSAVAAADSCSVSQWDSAEAGRPEVEAGAMAGLAAGDGPARRLPASPLPLPRPTQADTPRSGTDWSAARRRWSCRDHARCERPSSRASESNWDWMLAMRVAASPPGRSVRPTDPLNSTSPPKTMPSPTKLTLPGECPGVNRTVNSKPPT